MKITEWISSTRIVLILRTHTATDENARQKKEEKRYMMW